MPKPRTVRAFSAGGVVFRRVADARAIASAQAVPQAVDAARASAEVVLVGRARENFWVLPKGTPQPGETTEQVALREVSEETGVSARIVAELGSIHYWFSRRGVRFNKEVFYYLMQAIGGSVEEHDHEYDDARWFPTAEAAQRLTFENEASILRQAEPLIADVLQRDRPA